MYHVFPWVHQYVNNLLPEHQTQGVSFPDINPADLPPNAQFSMAAGDFLEVCIHLYPSGIRCVLCYLVLEDSTRYFIHT